MKINIPSAVKKIREAGSSHKILPANKIEKSSLIRPVIPNNNGVQINEYNSKKKTSLQILKDKIFSPGDFLTSSKNESRNQKLINELSKKLLESSGLSLLTSKKSTENMNKSSLSKNSSTKINSTIGQTTPFLPEKYFSNKKTLILDLDETLVHSALKPFYIKSDMIFNMTFENKLQTIHVLKRPHVDEFLDKMSNIYELVIFTASIPEYANPLLNKLDPHKRITYRLFREHCTQSNSLFIKDLRKCGRNLKDTIIIDNNPVSYFFNKENGIPILTWHSNQTDGELMKLVPLLEYMAKAEDVRDVIREVVSGNFVNYHKVNKMLNQKPEKSGLGLNKKPEEEKNGYSFLFSINGLGKKETNLKNPVVNSSSTRNEKINLSTIKNTFSHYYFDSKEKKTGDKIRDSLNLNFDMPAQKSSNLFEDKKYQEKYEQFYEPTKTSKNMGFSSKENLVLPSNNCHSSSKNIRATKFSNTTKHFYTSSSLNHNELNSNVGSFDKDENYSYRAHKHFQSFVSPKRNFDSPKKQSSLTKTIEKKSFEFELNPNSRGHFEQKHYGQTATATISLNDKSKYNFL